MNRMAMAPIRITHAVKLLLIGMGVLFLVQNISSKFFGFPLEPWFGLVPRGFLLEFELWQIVTFNFFHGDIFHLILNGLMLAFIGPDIERTWGSKKFLIYFLVSSAGGGLLYLVLQALFWTGAGSTVPLIGASAGIYGLLTAYGILYGERTMLFMLLFPMKAKHFVWLLMGVEFLSTLFSGRGGLSAAAHLGGMITGFLYLWGYAMLLVTKRRREEQKSQKNRAIREQKRSHLKLIVNNDDDDDQHSGGGTTWH